MSEESEEIETIEEDTQSPSSKKVGEKDAFVFKNAISIFPYETIPHLSQGDVIACKARGKKGENYLSLIHI